MRDATKESIAIVKMMRAELRAMLAACEDMESAIKQGADWADHGTINHAFNQCLDCAGTMREFLGQQE